MERAMSMCLQGLYLRNITLTTKHSVCLSLNTRRPPSRYKAEEQREFQATSPTSLLLVQIDLFSFCFFSRGISI